VGGCPAQSGGVVEDTYEQQKRRSLAQSDQVAAVPSRKLICLFNLWRTAADAKDQAVTQWGASVEEKLSLAAFS
jgi:hypothetical protein